MRIVKSIADPECPGDQVSVLMSDSTVKRIPLLEWHALKKYSPHQRCDANRKPKKRR
jgi:hypothetical protein